MKSVLISRVKRNMEKPAIVGMFRVMGSDWSKDLRSDDAGICSWRMDAGTR